jgi:hypothetical protein
MGKIILIGGNVDKGTPLSLKGENKLGKLMAHISATIIYDRLKRTRIFA